MPLVSSLVGTRIAGQRRTITADDVLAARDLPLAAAVSLGLPALGALLIEPRIGLSMMRLAEVAHRIDVRVAPCAGDVLQTTATLAAIAPAALGETFDVHLETRAACGAVIVDATATILMRGPRRRDGVVIDDTVASPASGTTIIVEVGAEQGRALAAALGDHNPIYVDDDAAAQAGLPGLVLPNLGVLALAAGRVDGARRQASARFVRPALAGDTLRITHWPVDDGVAFRVENQEGVVVLDDGRLGGAA